MSVICPKCQFENQTDQHTSRIICARCATIIDAGMGYETSFGGYDNALRPTAQVNYPMAAGGSRPMEPNDVYATRIEDDFDDLLEDIPRNTQVAQYPYNSDSYNSAEQSSAFEDVFGQQQNGYDLSLEPRAGSTDHYYNQTAGALDSPTFDPPSYGTAPEPDFMGWPVLPEDSTDPGLPPATGLSQQSNWVKPLMMAGLLMMALAAGWYYFFGGGMGRNGKTSTPTPLEAVADQSEVPTGGTDVATIPDANSGKSAVDPVKPMVPDDGKGKTEKSPVALPPVQGPSGAVQPVVPPATNKAGASAANTNILTAPKPPVAAVPPKNTTSPAPAVGSNGSGIGTTPNRGGITIQVASFSSQAEASDRVAKLQAQGVTARVVTANLGGRGTWYRVQVGRFGSREAASGYVNQMRAKGLVNDALVMPAN